jgi:hypothetical protein
MTKSNINYSKTVIYKIVCNDLNVKDMYIGHTTEFTKRKTAHKTDCNNTKLKKYNLKLYKTIRDNGNWENWSMIEIEKYPCTDGNEARARERYWYEYLNANLNKQCPNRGEKEYNKQYKDEYVKHQHNKDTIREYQNMWYLENKKIICDKMKAKYQCTCGRFLSFSSKQHHEKSQVHLTYLKT